MIRVPVFSDFFEYAVDATQRSLLFWDTLRERGNEYLRHEAAGKPPLLKFGHEMLLDGRTLEKPCNYALLRILPGDGDLPTDPALAALRRGRSARRAWSRDRRLQGGQRDRQCAEARPSRLLRHLLSGPRAGATAGRRDAGRSALPGVGARPPPGCPGRSLCHRQLPGRMGHHGSGRRAARAARSDPDRRRGTGRTQDLCRKSSTPAACRVPRCGKQRSWVFLIELLRHST